MAIVSPLNNATTTLDVGTNTNLTGAFVDAISFTTEALTGNLEIYGSTIHGVLGTLPTTDIILEPAGGGKVRLNYGTQYRLLGIGAAHAIEEMPALTNGALLIGVNGGSPVAGTITAGAGILVTNAAGSITITNTSPGGASINTITPDAGAVVIPAANNVNLLGGSNIRTTGAGATLTFDVTGTTDHSLLTGNVSGSISSLGVALDGEIPIGRTGNGPILANISSGNNITVSNGSGSIALNLTGTTNHAVQVGDATGSLDSIAVGATGTLLVGATGANPAFATSAAGDFTFVNNTAATTRSLSVENNDTDPGSYACIAVSSEPLGGDAFIFFEIDSATQYYSLGIDNSDSDNLKLTNNTSPSAGTELIEITPAGVITLNNDLDVTEGGTGVSTLTSHGILMGNGTGDVQATAEPSNGQLLIGKTGDFAQLATLSNGNNITCTGGAGTISIAVTGTTDKQMLLGNASGSLSALGAMSDGNLIIGSTGNAPVIASLTSTGGTITITPGAGTINLEAVASGTSLTWAEETGASKTIVVNYGYIANRGTEITFTLPATSAVGTVFAIVGKGAGGWKVAQAANQYIRLGNVVSTTGIAGYAEFNNQYDCIEAVCVEANLGWYIRSAIGNITLA